MAKNIMETTEGKSGVLRMIQLTESNIEKAEIVLAVKGEIVDKLQRQSEVINNMGVDVLGPLLDRIKAEHGLEAADSFRDNIRGLLQHAVDTLMDVKDKISTETLKLTGDITSEPNVADLGMDDDISMDVKTPEFDFEDEAEFSGDLEDLASEPVPMDREMKESVQPRLGVQLKSKTGKVGNKYFESKQDMQDWLALNEHKIDKVLKILK